MTKRASGWLGWRRAMSGVATMLLVALVPLSVAAQARQPEGPAPAAALDAGRPATQL